MKARSAQSAPAARDRCWLQQKVLDDPKLGHWFLDVCMGREPSAEVDEALLALVEGGELVRKASFGWILTADGRQFGRDLGLIPGPAAVEEISSNRGDWI